MRDMIRITRKKSIADASVLVLAQFVARYGEEFAVFADAHLIITQILDLLVNFLKSIN